MLHLRSVFLVTLIVQFLVISAKCQEKDIDESEQSVPDEWRAVPPEPENQPPVIQIKLLKSTVSGNKNIVKTVEYEYVKTTEDENVAEKKPSATIEKPKSTIVIKGIDDRQIIDVPSFRCPEGQARDHFGKCRDIFEPPMDD